MPSLPIVSGRETVRALERAGFEAVRQHGSHVNMKKQGHPFIVTVPQHATLKRGTLSNIISKAGLTVQEFIDLL